MSDKIALIAIDWGTTNRRAWAFTGDGRVVDKRIDAGGLLAIPKDGFISSFMEMIGPWRGKDERIPALMCGMVGSKLGWVEAPYLRVPIDMKELSSALTEAPGIDAVWIVPGICDDKGEEPDVMRGEECQILGAMLTRDAVDGVLLLPGTHSKWAIVNAGRLTRFRTYMTGEIFSILSNTGTLAQLMTAGGQDQDAFDRGLARGRTEDAALLHNLFGVRTLALFERIPRTSLASYLSGLLIAAEIADAVRWIGDKSAAGPVIAVGSAQLLANYDRAARQFGMDLETTESGILLPSALLTIARRAGLISQ
jgi:2-dehydro-3-deoxygalactonokinase